MENNKNSARVGTGFCELLTITFIVLKLCKVITWSWVWVLSPLWIGTILGVLLILIAIAYAWWRSR